MRYKIGDLVTVINTNEIKTIIDVEFGKSVKCWVLIPEIKQVD